MIWLVVVFVLAVVAAQQRAVAAGRLASALAAWLKAGRTPLEALRGLRDGTDSPAIARALDAAVHDMETGAPLSRALRDSGLVLPPSFLQGLRAVEESGLVADWLDLEAERFGWRADVRAKGLLGLIYPLLVLLVLFETSAFLSTYITPTFVSLHEGMEMALPWQTEAVRTLGHLNGPRAQIAASVIIVLVIVALAYPTLLPLVDLLGSLPFVRRLRDVAGCEEAASMLAALVQGSLSLPAALHTASSAMSMSVWRRAFSRAEKDVMMGMSLSESLANQREVPRLFVEACEVGERTEDLPQTLAELGVFYQSQLTRLTHRFVRLGEVTLLWSLGLCVFVYVLGVWLPLVNLLRAMAP